MAENDSSDIIEHHVEEEMEKESKRSSTGSVQESRSPSEPPGARSGTQSSHRLLSYSDAVISIIATVMILPVAHTKVDDEEDLSDSVQLLLTTKIAVYLMTFLIVTVAWAAHIRLFQVIDKIDDSLALLNLVSMDELVVSVNAKTGEDGNRDNRLKLKKPSVKASLEKTTGD